MVVDLQELAQRMLADYDARTPGRFFGEALDPTAAQTALYKRRSRGCANSAGKRSSAAKKAEVLTQHLRRISPTPFRGDRTPLELFVEGVRLFWNPKRAQIVWSAHTISGVALALAVR